MKDLRPIEQEGVNHGYVARAMDWPRSTIHRYVKRGMLAKDWACVPNNGDFGER